MSNTTPIIETEDLKKHFIEESGHLFKDQLQVKAVDGVDLSIKKGETFGVVGESGCGKSTLGRTIVRLYNPTNGSVKFKGKDISHMDSNELKPLRKDMQLIFQDPYSSLNPRMTIGEIVTEPLKIHSLYDENMKNKAKDLLESVGLDKSHYNRYPHALSGGQRQRVGIARALIVEPDFIVADEPVSALDVSIQAQILNLLHNIKEEFDLTLLFIAHDLKLIQYFCDRVAVMYLGEFVEVAPTDKLFDDPLHPYTKALMSSAPLPDPHNRDEEKEILEGEPPSPIDPPSGCRFSTRCPEEFDRCSIEPELLEVEPDHYVSCHLYD